MSALPPDKPDAAAGLVLNLLSVISTLKIAMNDVTMQLDQIQSTIGTQHPTANHDQEEGPATPRSTQIRQVSFGVKGDEGSMDVSQTIPHVAHEMMPVRSLPHALPRQDFTRGATGSAGSAGQERATTTETWEAKVVNGLDNLAKLMKEYSVVPEDGWPKLWTRLRAMDQAKIDDYRDDIDTLLVFAGLFSAIVTAFVIAFYVTLQPSSADISAFILYQITIQLATAFPINGTSFDSSQLSVPTFPFKAPQFAVRITVLWFASLIFALSSASFGILVKQWLREFMALEDGPYDQRCRLRHFRDWHMGRWRVYDIASFLPLLLQAAVVVFLVGLRDFAASIHSTLGWVTTSFIIVYLALFVFTLLAPVIWEHSPFKTPFLKTFLQFPRYLYLRVWQYLEYYQYWEDERSRFWKMVRLSALSRFLNITGDALYHTRFTSVKKYWSHGYSAFEHIPRVDSRYDVPLVLFSDAVFRDSNMERTYQICLQHLDWTIFQQSTLFSSQPTTIRLDTQADFNRFWSQLSPNCERPVAECLCSMMEDNPNQQDLGSFLDIISHRLLFDSYAVPYPYSEVVKDSRLSILARVSPHSAECILDYLPEAQRRNGIDLKSIDMAWASGVQCVTNLLEAYRYNMGHCTAWYGVLPLVVVVRAISQLTTSARDSVQIQFSECLSKLIEVLNDPESAWREEFVKLDPAPFIDYLDLVDRELLGFVLGEVLSFFAERRRQFSRTDGLTAGES